MLPQPKVKEARIGTSTAMSEKAAAVLVFPGIVKGGFIVGGQYGEGALIISGKTVAFYNTIAASYGLQAGAQKYGYAMFFMTEDALRTLTSTSAKKRVA